MRRLRRAIDELAGKAQAARRGLPADLLLALALEAVLGLLDHPFEQLARLLRRSGEPVVEGIADRGLDDAGRFLGGEAVLGLALELRLADEHRQHRRGRAHHIVGGDLRGLLVVDEFAVGAQPLRQRRAQAALVRAAIGRRNGVAVAAGEAVLARGPGDRPLDVAVAGFLDDAAGEDVLGDEGLPLDRGGQVVLQPAREMEHGLGRGVVLDQLRRAVPADLDAAEQVSLGTRHRHQPAGLEGGALAEDLLVREEAHLGAAPVHGRAELLQLALRDAAVEHHAVELLAARDLDLADLRQRVHHRDADAVQAAGCLVGLAVELAARVQRGHDHFERGLVLEFRMRINRYTASIVHHRQVAVGLVADLDEGGVARHRLVHRVVDHLGEQMVQRLLVGAADVHAGASPDGLQALQHLDVGGGVGVRSIGLFARAFDFCRSCLRPCFQRDRVRMPWAKSESGAATRSDVSLRSAAGWVARQPVDWQVAAR